MAKKQRNSPERALMLEERRFRQKARSGGTMRGVPAWKNRRTGEPHEHARQTARYAARP